MTISLSTSIRNAVAGILNTSTYIGGLALEIRSGTRPATLGSSPPDGLKLGQLTMPGVSIGTISAGNISVGTLTNDASADNTGTATWWRIVFAYSGSLLMPTMDGTCGVTGSGADLTMDNVTITAGAPINVVSFTIYTPHAT